MNNIIEVPVSGAVIDEKDQLKLMQVIMSKWFTEGYFCDEFSTKLKKYIGARHCILVNSGSSANLLAVSAIKDFYTTENNRNKVVTCATGFPTTVGAIVQAGLVPLFVDVNPKTLNPDTNVMLSALARPDVVGIIQAHTLGFPFDAKAIREYCDENNKFFIEDCCDALGAEIYGEKCGSFGHASTYSFFPAHHITTGEGGAVLTNDGRLMRQIEKYRDWGRDCWCLPGQSDTCNKRFSWEWNNLPEGWDHKYTFTNFGYNLKMTEWQGALGSSQIDKIDEFINKRGNNFADLFNYLNQYREWISFPDFYWNTKSRKCSPFGFPITVNANWFTRKELVDYLEAHKIHTRPVFAGNITRQPMFDNVEYEVHGNLDGSDYVMERTFWIGCWHGLTQVHLDYVVNTFRDFFEMKGLK